MTYAGREAVLYRDKLQGNYEAEKIAIPAGATNVAAADLNNDGWIDVVYTAADGTHVAWNKNGSSSRPGDASPTAVGFRLRRPGESWRPRYRVRTRACFGTTARARFTARQTDLPSDCAVLDRRAISTTTAARTSPAARSTS